MNATAKVGMRHATAAGEQTLSQVLKISSSLPPRLLAAIAFGDMASASQSTKQTENTLRGTGISKYGREIAQLTKPPCQPKVAYPKNTLSTVGWLTYLYT